MTRREIVMISRYRRRGKCGDERQAGHDAPINDEVIALPALSICALAVETPGAG